MTNAYRCRVVQWLDGCTFRGIVEFEPFDIMAEMALQLRGAAIHRENKLAKRFLAMACPIGAAVRIHGIQGRESPRVVSVSLERSEPNDLTALLIQEHRKNWSSLFPT